MVTIPDGWQRITLEDYIDIKHGFAFKSEFFTDEGHYVLMTPGSFFESGGFRDRGDKTKYYFGEIPGGYILKKGDVLLAMTEQAEGLLGSAAYVPEDNKYLHNQRLERLKIKDPKRLCIEYLYLFYNSPFARKQISEQSTGTKVKHTSPDKLKGIIFLLPSLPEQKKIAKILSTCDRAIEVTEKLLKNSQEQKKPLMQQLLTGKKRLPGFSGEWSNAKFEEILDIEIGGTPSRSKPEYWDDQKVTKNRWLSIRDLRGNKILDTSEYISDLGVQNSNVTLISAGTIVMSFKLTIGRCAFLGVDSYTNEAISALIIKKPDELDNNYLLHALNVVDFDREIDQAVKGKTLNKAKLKRLHLKLPELKEQQKISSVLSTADKEIENLQQKLNCLRQEKKALMQQLLTGKRRVTL